MNSGIKVFAELIDEAIGIVKVVLGDLADG